MAISHDGSKRSYWHVVIHARHKSLLLESPDPFSFPRPQEKKGSAMPDYRMCCKVKIVNMETVVQLPMIVKLTRYYIMPVHTAA